VIANVHLLEDRFPVQLAGERNPCALAEVAAVPPLVFASAADTIDIGTFLDVVDEVFLTGARANIHPRQFGTEPRPAHECSDEDRDEQTLALIEVCVAQGVPILGVCRGPQEMNAAVGGSLHPEIHQLPGLMLHGHAPRTWRKRVSV
jgi:putative glutamine amidotransferase